MDCKSFLLHGHLCHVALHLHFPVRISNKYYFWCDRELKTDQQDFHSFYLCFYSDVAPRALLSVVNCVRAFPQELRCCFPSDIPRNWILWDAGSLGTVKAGVLLRGTLPLLHHHLERLVKKKSYYNTNFKIKSSILYIFNVNIIYFLLCCILWEFYPYVWKESYFLSKVLKSVALYLCLFSSPNVCWACTIPSLSVWTSIFLLIVLLRLQFVHPVVFSLPQLARVSTRSHPEWLPPSDMTRSHGLHLNWGS